METTETAIALMERALALLDQDAQGRIACHLQNALDVAEDVAPVRSGEMLALDEETAFFDRMDASRASAGSA
ncbi:hypothetical protein [Sphingomonas mollis]|uniref:Uncharacterized protein n=1 Tax=Sphingomonas mollis TaxID=2795726 RepID=A0ABS0XU76_9SPHN|nr:hypothetical protein [Sphingomonas sp. BT553]MBJ6123597.1 hypothetical protein [Sphingomonas sp. BT553]